MKEASLSLEEVAAALRVRVDVVRRSLQSGHFPGRFLADGEVRIPAHEVELERGHLAEGWDASVAGGDGGEKGRGLHAEGLARLKEEIASVFHEEHRGLQKVVLEVLEKQQRKLDRLEALVSGLRREMVLDAADEDWSVPLQLEAGSRLGAKAVLEEIDELEALLLDEDVG